MALMIGGGADGANCYCRSLWIFGADKDIRHERYRNGDVNQCHSENRRGTLDRELYGKKF